MKETRVWAAPTAWALRWLISKRPRHHPTCSLLQDRIRLRLLPDCPMTYVFGWGKIKEFEHDIRVADYQVALQSALSASATK